MLERVAASRAIMVGHIRGGRYQQRPLSSIAIRRTEFPIGIRGDMELEPTFSLPVQGVQPGDIILLTYTHNAGNAGFLSRRLRVFCSYSHADEPIWRHWKPHELRRMLLSNSFREKSLRRDVVSIPVLVVGNRLAASRMNLVQVFADCAARGPWRRYSVAASLASCRSFHIASGLVQQASSSCFEDDSR